MKAEELFQLGMDSLNLADETDNAGVAAANATIAQAYFGAAQTRSSMDAQSARLAAMERITTTEQATQLPVTNFIQAVDFDGDRLFLDEQGTFRCWPINHSSPAPGNWTPLYVRGTS